MLSEGTRFKLSSFPALTGVIVRYVGRELYKLRGQLFDKYEVRLGGRLSTQYLFECEFVVEPVGVNRSYAHWASELTLGGYIPLGRYEHTMQRDSIAVMTKWMKVDDPLDMAILEVSTDDNGNLDKVVGVYSGVING